MNTLGSGEPRICSGSSDGRDSCNRAWIYDAAGVVSVESGSAVRRPRVVRGRAYASWWQAREWIVERLTAECPPDQEGGLHGLLSGVGPPIPYASGLKDSTEVGRAQPRYREPNGLYDIPFAASADTIGSTSATSSEVLAQPVTTWSGLIASMVWRDSDREVGAEPMVRLRLRAGSCV